VTATYENLLAALAGAPSLPGAKCRNRSHLFDEDAPGEEHDTVAARHAQAIGLCAHCPARDRCTEWVDGLKPSRRPPGVVAARINGPRPADRPKGQQTA
jgi:hypothetical protein